jgi:hypothetical protein
VHLASLRKVRGDAQDVAREMVELQGALVVVRFAVAARIPCRRGVVLREVFELLAPVAVVAADAVQEEEQRPFARDGDCDARRGTDVDGFQGYSAFAPEIFTARARLSLSFLM